MRFVFVAGILFASRLALAAFHPTVEAESPADIKLRIDVGDKDYRLETVSLGGVPYVKVVAGEGLNQVPALFGKPDLPRMHRWLAVDPGQRYTAEWRLEDPVTYSGVLLYPAQEDAPDCGDVAPPVLVDKASYVADEWMGRDAVVLGRRSRLGAVSVLPVTIFPMQYHPLTRELVVWRKISVHLYAEKKEAVFFEKGTLPSHFARQQVAALVLNGKELLHATPLPSAPKRVLVLTSADLVDQAKALTALYPADQVKATVREVEAGASSADVRAAILEEHAAQPLDDVLLFGDAKRIPLHKWTSSMPGDAFYSFLDGDDYIADVALGRLPVGSLAEARIMLSKLRKYRELQKAGQVNKRVALVAHKQGYPGKYTANQEQIRELENPKGLDYVPLYGGAGATNDDVIEQATAGMGIINYRGHGGTTNWQPWGQDNKAFGAAQVDELPQDAAKMPVFFNIACLNGGIHSQSRALVLKELFPSADETSFQGGIAALGATIESSTEVNHRFDLNLFRFLGESEDVTLGNVYAAANNQLVQDNGGEAVGNVKMYILFSDPLLAPWVQ